MLPVARRAVVAASFVLGALGCDKRKAPSEGSGPPPAESVISIANAFGACEDIPLCERECDGGAADRCRRLGATYQFGNRVERDEKRALKYFELACTMANAPACMSAGQMYEYHHGVDEDDARGAAFYKKSCDLGYSPGCANYAIMLENGRGVTKDLPKAAALYEKACKEGAGLACERLKVLANDGSTR